MGYIVNFRGDFFVRVVTTEHKLDIYPYENWCIVYPNKDLLTHQISVYVK